MKTLIYDNGVLTIINNDNFFQGLHDKPDFIIGKTLHYEPGYKKMDDKDIDPALKTMILNYINSFDFENRQPGTEETPKHTIDRFGNYIGLNLKGLVVPSPPASSLKNPYWNGTTYVEGVVIDSRTKTYIGLGDNRDFDYGIYAPEEGMDIDFDKRIQKYITDKWVMDMTEARDCRLTLIKKAYDTAIKGKYETNDFVNFEDTTFPIQVQESEAYIEDNNAETPMLDGLLDGRGFENETKDTLTATILLKNKVFKSIGYEIGLYHKLLKQIKTATTIEDLRSINW